MELETPCGTSISTIMTAGTVAAAATMGAAGVVIMEVQTVPIAPVTRFRTALRVRFLLRAVGSASGRAVGNVLEGWEKVLAIYLVLICWKQAPIAQFEI